MVVMIAQRATFAESRRVRSSERAPLLFGDGQWPRIRTEGDALVRRLNPTSSLPTFLPSTSAPFSLRAPLGSSSLKSCPTTELIKGENAENDSLPVDCGGQNERTMAVPRTGISSKLPCRRHCRRRCRLHRRPCHHGRRTLPSCRSTPGGKCINWRTGGPLLRTDGRTDRGRTDDRETQVGNGIFSLPCCLRDR